MYTTRTLTTRQHGTAGDKSGFYGLAVGIGLALSAAILSLVYRVLIKGGPRLKDEVSAIQFANTDLLNKCLQQRIQAIVGYTFESNPDINQLGKNKCACIVFSHSRRDSTVKKLWFSKPFYAKDVANGDYYDLKNATNEVFFAYLSVIVIGKKYTAKTKFNLKERGVVSRVLGDGVADTSDLCTFIALDSQAGPILPQQAQQSFLNAVLFGIIIGDRDLKPENLIVKAENIDDNYAPIVTMVYGIDREFAASVAKIDRISLRQLLQILYKDPKDMALILFDYSFKWNIVTRDQQFSQSELAYWKKLLVDWVTREQFVQTLCTITDAIAANNFQACSDTKLKIYKKILMQR